MASKPGILTDWPWKPLGNFKYVILAPWAIHSVYSIIIKDEKERDFSYFLIFPFLLWRMLHNQIWISLSRYRTAKGHNRIVDKPIEFEQVDRERSWDDQIIFNGILFYIIRGLLKGASHLPWWRTDGVIITFLLHVGPVEFLYYWFHRALHHHFLYSRYHSHHHSSIVTEPITSVIHPFAEHIGYYLLFSIPQFTLVFTKTSSIMAVVLYTTFVDFMNNMGHCNFELVPKKLFSIFPLLNYLMYTPSFHSLHHTQFRTNYSLFMPIYDYIYGTMDKSTDATYENSLKRPEDLPDVVHLTHLTTPDSIYHLRLGFTYLASKPRTSKWYLGLMWPLTFWSIIITWFSSRAFVLERNTFQKLKLQTWMIPRYNLQYFQQWRRDEINSMIEDAILEADKRGVKVLSLGLLNQKEELNGNGELYIQKHPKLKVKVVDGSSLAVAVLLNSIPNGTSQVLLRGNLSKVAYAIADVLCQRGIQVAISHKEHFEKLKSRLTVTSASNLVLSRSYAQKIWLVGDGMSKDEQLKAAKGTLFIPYSQFPPMKTRKDCLYHSTPALIVPKCFENMDSCENWLGRRVMSAGRIAGIVHALEGWNVDECGQTMVNIHQAWQATLQHGFRPLMIPKY